MPQPQFGALSVDVESTVDRVLAELRRAVFEGDLAPGTPLREVALADSLQVSRSTVREALALLVSDGLAVRVANKGTTVREPTAAAIHDVSAARTVLETAGVRAWSAAGEALREGVRAAFATYAEAAKGRAANAELNEAHLDFHRSLVALTGSERLVATQEALAAEIRLALAAVNRSRRDALEQLDSHRLLLDLLEADDLAAAEAELARHIADGRDSMIIDLGL